MTLRECIAHHEAQQPAQVTLTPLGAAVRHANRLASSLQLLSAIERLHVLGLLTDQLAAPAHNKPPCSAGIGRLWQMCHRRLPPGGRTMLDRRAAEMLVEIVKAAMADADAYAEDRARAIQAYSAAATVAERLRCLTQQTA